MKTHNQNMLRLQKETQIAKFMGPTWVPPGSCRPQMGPIWAPWPQGNYQGPLTYRKGSPFVADVFHLRRPESSNLQCLRGEHCAVVEGSGRLHRHKSFHLSHMSDECQQRHYNGVIMSMKASKITSLTIVYLGVYSGEDLRKHQSPASLALVRGIHRWPVNSPHKRPVTRECFHRMTSSW